MAAPITPGLVCWVLCKGVGNDTLSPKSQLLSSSSNVKCKPSSLFAYSLIGINVCISIQKTAKGALKIAEMTERGQLLGCVNRKDNIKLLCN